eukprot:4814535-Pyramimonas_sp.AAC.1
MARLGPLLAPRESSESTPWSPRGHARGPWKIWQFRGRAPQNNHQDRGLRLQGIGHGGLRVFQFVPRSTVADHRELT